MVSGRHRRGIDRRESGALPNLFLRMSLSSTVADKPANSTRRILFASLAGTAIEFFDFYIYATATVLVFPKLFFPAGDPAMATLQSLATFAPAFFARPEGAAVFGFWLRAGFFRRCRGC